MGKKWPGPGSAFQLEMNFKTKPLDYNINPQQYFSILYFAGNEHLIIKLFFVCEATQRSQCTWKGEIIKFATLS